MNATSRYVSNCSMSILSNVRFSLMTIYVVKLFMPVIVLLLGFSILDYILKRRTSFWDARHERMAQVCAREFLHFIEKRTQLCVFFVHFVENMNQHEGIIEGVYLKRPHLWPLVGLLGPVVWLLGTKPKLESLIFAS